MITDVRLRNWRSHWDSSFKFSGGTNALIGVMGAGKSSLLDSMCFALFGTFPALQAKRLTLDNVIMNRPQRKDEAEVTLSFKVGEDTYTVRRTVERGKGTTKAEIRKNNTLLDTGSSRVTENVQSVLKVDYDLFSRAIYSEQNGLDQFLTIPRGQRMKRIDSLLKIDRFEKARSSTTTLVNRLRENVKDKSRIVSEMEEKEDFGKIDGLEKEVRGLRKSQVELELKRESLEREKKKLEDRAGKLKESMKGIQEKEKERDILSGTIKNLSEDLEYLEEVSNEKEIKEKITKKAKEMESETKKLEEAESKVRELLAKESKLKLFIEELSGRVENLSLASGKCPVCDRKLTDAQREKIIEESRLEIGRQEENLKKVSGEVRFIEESSAKLKEKLGRTRDEKYELEGALQKAIRYMEKKKRLEESEKRKKELDEDIGKMRRGAEEENAEEVQSKLRELSGSYSGTGVSIENNARLITERELQLKELIEKRKTFERHREQIGRMNDMSEDLKRFEKALKETQVTLRREFVDSVNFTMDRIWEYLYPYEDLTNIRLSVNGGDYNLELKEAEGNWVSVEGIASGGERTTACLALRIAFALVLAPNLKWLVLDEPTHNLDSHAVEYLAGVLRDRVGEFVEQVFLITHDEKLEDAVTGYLYRLERKREKSEPTQVNLVSAPKD